MTLKVNPVTLLASPLGEEGHKVAKGWTVVILLITRVLIMLYDTESQSRNALVSP